MRGSVRDSERKSKIERESERVRVTGWASVREWVSE